MVARNTRLRKRSGPNRPHRAGLPIEAVEISGFCQNVVTNAENHFVAVLMDEPQNAGACVRTSICIYPDHPFRRSFPPEKPGSAQQAVPQPERDFILRVS